MKRSRLSLLLVFILFYPSAEAQINESKLGAWYMYFWNTTVKESCWGFQGDIQYRNWNTLGDLEQLLLRSGATYKPKSANVKFTLGYGHIQTGVYGESSSTVQENRVYQEALIPHELSKRVKLTHRFRYEQRLIENQDLRTRFRYNFFLNIHLSNPENTNGIYLAFYNELFINGERQIGNGRVVELFDRNRAYGAIGYKLNDNLKIQLGIMHQLTDNWGKTQKQLSLHHTF